uniref:Stabilin 1 n=1 Tax=Monodelphis domestica TaxID=13616 RepID=F6RL05_MONDO
VCIYILFLPLCLSLSLSFKNQDCPVGWSKNWEKESEDCRYRPILNSILIPGCTQKCSKEVEEKACCPGFWGSQCYECPGGAQNPCNGHGACLDGIGQNGTCVCEVRGWEMDMEGRSGEGDGSCLCFAGYTGLELPACKALACPKNSQCVGADTGAPSCKCLPGFLLQASKCQAQNPCSPFPCSSFATCSALESGGFECRCKAGYHGDGKFCQPVDPCASNNGGCPSNTTKCVYQRPGKVTRSSGPGRRRRGRRGASLGAGPGGPNVGLLPSCVCKEGEIGNGRSCYGHFLRELERKKILRSSLRTLDTPPNIFLLPSMKESMSRSLCKLHIIPGVHLIENGFQTTKTWWTLDGESLTLSSNFRLKIYRYKDQPDQSYEVILANLPAANGIFHLVSSLRKQPSSAFIQGDPEKSIGKILASMDVFSRFETILENCGLPSILEGPGPFTVFVPSNSAVDSLRDGRLIYLFTESCPLIPQLTVDKLISLKKIPTLANQVLMTNFTPEGRFLWRPSGIPLKSMDIVASNGIIHLLDGILLPPSILPILPHRCNENQYTIVTGTCGDCQNQNTSVCPPNSQELDIFPKECFYIHDPDGLNVMRKGCARVCNQTTLKLGCCKGFFGPECSQCPGGFSNPCYGKGNCSDGIQGNGACICQKAFKGIACHVCADPNRHGEQCEEECGCVHGICDNRPGSGGICQKDTCTKGFTGPFCNESLADCSPAGLAQYCHPLARCVTLQGRSKCVCPPGFQGDGFSCSTRHPCDQPDRGGCSENAQCVRSPSEPHQCVCNKGWKGDGKDCVAINECELETRGGCHAEAQCHYIGPGQSSCTCKPGFAGDGYQCSRINPCLVANGGCHVLVSRTGLRPGRLSLPPWLLGRAGARLGDQGRELKRNNYFAGYYQWIKKAGFALPTKGNFTALVPSESAIQSMSPEDKAFWLQQQQLLHLLRSHFVPDALTIRQLSDLSGQEVVTLNPPTRWEISNSSGKITIQNVSMEVADILATNGVLHILSKVCVSTPASASLKEGTDYVCQRTSETYLCACPGGPRSEAWGIPASLWLFCCEPCPLSLQDLETVKRHVLLGEALTPEAMRPGMHRNSLLGTSYELVFSSGQGSQPLVNRVPVVGPTLQPQGGVVLQLGEVLTQRPNICLRSHIEGVRVRTGWMDLTSATLSLPSSYSVPTPICPQMPDCCPGYFGTLCDPCPGGAGSNCSGHGQCQDGRLGNGECRCHEGFHGTACEGCELGRYGLNCAGVCNCGHGICQDGLLGNGTCSCNVGWKGPHCDQEITASSLISDDCINASCVCSAGYSGNGTNCSEVDPCVQDHGGCSLHANCTKVAPGQRTCTCKEGYAGDGEICLEINSCLSWNGGCHAKADCVPIGSSKVSDLRNGETQDDSRLESPTSCCSPYATCNNTGPGERTCACGILTIGDGFTCRTRMGLVRPHVREYQELKGEGPFTVFVPREDLMKNLTRRELSMLNTHRQLLFRYHTVGCGRLLTQDLLEAGYVTTLSGHKLHFSQNEGNLYINEYAQVVTEDQIGVNGVIHFIDKLLLPPEVVHWTDASSQNVTEAAESAGYTLFSKLLTMARMLPMFHDKAHQPLTVLWPSDEALKALSPERQAWLYHEDHREKLAAILRGHVIRNVKALASDIPNLGQLRTMHGSPISFSCSKALPGELLVGEGEARIVQRHMEFLGGIAYGIDQLLEPPGLGSRCDHYAYRQPCSSCDLLPLCPLGYKDQGEVDYCMRAIPSRRPFFLRYTYYDPFLFSRKTQKSGCRRRCFTVTWKPACCPGHYGIDCQVCPGGPGAPCNGNGVCDDGMTGTGVCKCHKGFNGTACELCAAGTFGHQSCQCTAQGKCDEGVSGSGFCFCNEGWSGQRCEIKLDEQPVCSPPCHPQAVCRKDNFCECSLDYEGDGRKCTVIDRCQNQHGGCSQHASCSQQGTVVTCTCLPDYEGDGVFCQARDPCADGQNGGCSEHAECISTGPNTRRCMCRPGYVGNGLQCLVEAVPPEDRCLESPGPCHPEATCTDLHFQEKRAGVFHLQAPEGKYRLTFGEAEKQCLAQGAELASLDQLSAAQQLGFHLCLTGWLSNGTAAYPAVYPSTSCNTSHAGIILRGTQGSLTERWDAYCYRLRDVTCQCRDGFVGDGYTVCNGKLLDVLAANANFSTFYGLLLDYANTTQHGLEFLGFLSDELTSKTLFVPINSGFGNNLTLSWQDLELHASNVTFLSLNLSQGTILPAHSGHQLFISNSSAGNISPFPIQEGTDVVRVSAVVEWDIIAFNGIIHAIQSPLTAPPKPVSAPLEEQRSRMRFVDSAEYRIRGAEDDEDDFSPWQQGPSPPLISVPNPTFGGHDTFYEPFDVSSSDKPPVTIKVVPKIQHSGPPPACQMEEVKQISLQAQKG